jgi:hypothetical protein
VSRQNRSARAQAFLTRGWCRFAYDETLVGWVEQALPAARAAVTATENAEWWRCGRTWFVGVNALPNDETGAIADGMPLSGKAVDFIRHDLGLRFTWDRAQVSVVYPSYPQPMASESAAGYRYRRERDAAHVDGVLREGPRKRRHLRRHHRFILGIPMVAVGPGASPLVVWEGSHEIVRRALADRFGDLPAACWRDEDIGTLYRSVRNRIFGDCERVQIAAQPGEAYLLHRLALHGIAPWSDTATAGPDGRMIVYFRPELDAPDEWLSAP